MTSSEPKKNIWNIVVPIMVILLIVFIVGVSYLLWSNAVAESGSTLYIWELNTSDVPQGNIISLTEEDFKELPPLALVIRDKNQKPVTILENGNRLYWVHLAMEERSKYNGKCRSVLEYKGKYWLCENPMS
jgi:hypothetical protein